MIRCHLQLKVVGRCWKLEAVLVSSFARCSFQTGCFKLSTTEAAWAGRMEAAVERPTAKQPSLGKLFFFGQVANSTQQTVALSIVILICSVTFDWIRKKIDRLQEQRWNKERANNLLSNAIDMP